MRVTGIDLGIKKVALAYVKKGKLLGTEAYESNSLLRTQQLMDISDYVYSEVKYFHPAYVFIEATLMGNNHKYSIELSQTMGAVLSGLGLLQTELPFDVHCVNVGAWKKATTGNGHASKDDVQRWVEEANRAYSGLCGGDQDRYDAAAIGLYGWILHERSELSLVEEVR